MIHEATCCCGALAVSFDGNLPAPSLCHCFQCQKRTGSTYGAQIRLKADDVQISGPSTVYTRTGDGGGVATFHFCPTCGSTVYWTLDGMPGSVIVAVGAFADPTFPAPTYSIYEDRIYPWVLLPDSIVTHGK